MNERIIRLATRGSALALWQAGRVADLIKGINARLEVELVVVSTSPDRHTEVPLAELGGDKGLFVKEVEQAVLDGRADAAVHSLKDVPVDVETPGLKLVAFPERAHTEDVLVSNEGLTLSQLAPGARIATGSLRRQAQLLALRSDVKTVDVRGNVQTRLAKLDAGQFDALLMARAGLERLKLGGRIAQVFGVDEMLPAAGQGIIVVQALERGGLDEVWSGLNDPKVETQAAVERAFVRAIGADCRSAAGCLCTIEGEEAMIRGFTALAGNGKLVRIQQRVGLKDVLAGAHKMAQELLLASTKL